MINLFTGPAPLVQLVRDELLKRGIGAHIRPAVEETAFAGVLLGTGWQSVVVTPEVAERERAAIDEVLALVSEPREDAPGQAERKA
jgi:hypothetical protein